MLEVSGLNHYYGESHTLWDLDLEIPPGSCTCLIGRNGVGKSTLLKCIMGLLPIKSGSIRILLHELTALPAYERASIGIGYVPQGREIFPLLTVEENLRVGLRGRNIPDLVFELFPVLRKMLHRRGGDLSGGQQQQLAIGRALVVEPALLILDEPTEGVQPNIVHEIGDIILRLNKGQAAKPSVEPAIVEETYDSVRRLNQEYGLTVLLVEQKLPFVRRIADRFYIMDKGRLVANGVIEDLSDKLIQRHLAV